MIKPRGEEQSHDSRGFYKFKTWLGGPSLTDDPHPRLRTSVQTRGCMYLYIYIPYIYIQYIL